MQDLALAEGALPRHLHSAMFTQSTDSRMLTVRSVETPRCVPHASALLYFLCRQLSRHLVGLWVTGHPTALALLQRIMPSGLLAYLDSEDEVPEDDIDRLHIRDNLKVRKAPSMHYLMACLDSLLWITRIGKRRMHSGK
jgi:DnaJ family protein C protein 13